MDEIVRKEFKNFAKRWGLDIENVDYVYYILDLTGNRYGKAVRILKKQNFDLSPRQLRYFVQKIKLVKKLRGNKPANFRDLTKKL